MKDKSANDEPAKLTTDSASISCVFENQLLIFFFNFGFLKIRIFYFFECQTGTARKPETY